MTPRAGLKFRRAAMRVKGKVKPRTYAKGGKVEQQRVIVAFDGTARATQAIQLYALAEAQSRLLDRALWDDTHLLSYTEVVTILEQLAKEIRGETDAS